MDLENIVARMVQIGRVSSVNETGRRVRVILSETGVVSDWLPCLSRFRHDLPDQLPKINDRVVVLYLPVADGDGFVLGVLP